MAIRKTYVSDLSGEAIDGKPVVLTLQRSTRKKNRYGSYTQTETKKLHLTKAESETLFNSDIRKWLGFESDPKPAKKETSPA